jgi:hypothetical protein
MGLHNARAGLRGSQGGRRGYNAEGCKKFRGWQGKKAGPREVRCGPVSSLLISRMRGCRDAASDMETRRVAGSFRLLAAAKKARFSSGLLRLSP